MLLLILLMAGWGEDEDRLRRAMKMMRNIVQVNGTRMGLNLSFVGKRVNSMLMVEWMKSCREMKMTRTKRKMKKMLMMLMKVTMKRVKMLTVNCYHNWLVMLLMAMVKTNGCHYIQCKLQDDHRKGLSGLDWCYKNQMVDSERDGYEVREMRLNGGHEFADGDSQGVDYD